MVLVARQARRNARAYLVTIEIIFVVLKFSNGAMHDDFAMLDMYFSNTNDY